LFVVTVTFGQNPAKNVLHVSVTSEVATTNGDATPQVKTLISYGGKTKVGSFCWIQVGIKYYQTYCGATYTPAKWAQLGAAVGFEKDKNPFRVGTFLWLGKGRFSNLLVVEAGGSGEWHRNVASYQAHKNVSLSVTLQRFAGVGARVDITIPKTHFKIGGEHHLATRISRFSVEYSF
jgi:hypothetical protein